MLFLVNVYFVTHQLVQHKDSSQHTHLNNATPTQTQQYMGFSALTGCLIGICVKFTVGSYPPPVTINHPQAIHSRFLHLSHISSHYTSLLVHVLKVSDFYHQSEHEIKQVCMRRIAYCYSQGACSRVR